MTTPMNKISIAPGLHSRPQSTKKGFTLIELLVVITIIAVLAGLLFPAMGAVRNQARKASAKNDITQLVNAIKAYQVEYMRYPDSSGKTGAQTISNNGTIVGILRASSTTDNAREIRFLEVPNAKNGRSGLEVSGTTASSTANWLDPWGNPYQIFINYDYKQLGNTSVTYQEKKADKNKSYTINTEVAASSKGIPEATTGEPIMSWQ